MPTFKNRISIFIWYIAAWALFGLSFYFFLRALLDLKTLNIFFASGCYIAAYNLGYISLITPGGLGVREGVMSALLAPTLGGPVAASISLIHRVLITLAEVVISLIAFITYRFDRIKAGDSPVNKYDVI